MKPPIEYRGARPAAKAATPLPAPAKKPPQPAKKAAPVVKAKKPAPELTKPKRQPTATPKALVAPDIPGLKQRLLDAKLTDQDWDDLTALLDATQARRDRNRQKQADFRAKTEKK